MNKTSKCLLFALSFLGSVHANVMSSFALGNVPPFGVEAIISDGNTNVQRGLETWHRYVIDDEPEYEYVADREATNADYELISDQPAAKEVQLEQINVTPDALETEIPTALLHTSQPVVNDGKDGDTVPSQTEESEAPVAVMHPAVTSKEEIPEETTEEVIKTKEIQTVNGNETTEIEEVSEQPKDEEKIVPEEVVTPVQTAVPAPVVSEQNVVATKEESEAPVAVMHPAVTSKEEIPEETTEEVIKTKEIQTVNGNETTEIEEVSEQPKDEEKIVPEEVVTPVQTAVPAPVVSEQNVVATEEESEAPVAVKQPEVKPLKSVSEVAAPGRSSKEVKANASKLTNVDPNTMLSQNVVKVALKYVPYLVALAKAKEAYTYIRKDRAFDLPHTSYRDLTMLPQFDEVKMFTSLLCGIFNIEMPTEDNMVSNYKQKLPNIVVANKYLDKILDDLYDCHEAQKNGTYKLNLSDLNFVNRMLISAVSNSEDDSSTLPVSKEDESTAKKLFGKKIASNLSNTTNEDGDAKAMLHKITNNEVKASV